MATLSLYDRSDDGDLSLGIPRELVPYRVGLTGGLLAGVGMAVTFAFWAVVSGASIWYPVNLIASTLLANLQGASPETLAQFNFTGAVVGTLIHFGLSTIIGVLFVILLPTLPGPPQIWAFVAGPLLLFIAGYIALPVLNPAMYTQASPIAVFASQTAFCAVLGLWVGRAPKVPLQA